MPSSDERYSRTKDLMAPYAFLHEDSEEREQSVQAKKGRKESMISARQEPTLFGVGGLTCCGGGRGLFPAACHGQRAKDP